MCGESQCSFEWVKRSPDRLWTGAGILLEYGSGTAVNGPSIRTSITSFSSLSCNYDPETRRLLDGTLLSVNATMNVNVAQDYWGAFISHGTNAGWAPSSTGVLQSSFNQNQSPSIKRVAMPNGIILSEIASAYMFDNGMDNFIARWIWYKWDGSNWVLAADYDPTTGAFTDTTGTSTRTTSTSYLNLLDGINIRFQNGATGTSFIAGEVYDQYVCKGVLKTNDTYVYVENSPFYTQPVYEKITLTPTTITAPNNYGVVVDGAPGNNSLSAATSAITVDPLWHSLLPEYDNNNITSFSINGVPVVRVYAETKETIPDPNTLTAGQIIMYRNGLILCSSADVGKTLTGFFSYVARSD